MAGRIRTIKPELRELEAFADLGDAAARLFVMLYTLADDLGRCPAGSAFLDGQVFYMRKRGAAAVGRMLGELERADLVRVYATPSGPHLEILGWSTRGTPTHQRVEKPQPARYPAPSSDDSGNAFRERSRPDLRPPTGTTDLVCAPLGSSPPELPDPPTIVGAEREDLIRRLVLKANAYAREGHAALLRGGVGADSNPNPNAWSPNAWSDGEARVRVEELLQLGDIAAVEAALTNRINVAIATAETNDSLEYFTPARIWNAKSFAIDVALSPAQVAPWLRSRAS